MDFNTVVYTEDSFSIRWGVNRYFIQHDPCRTQDSTLPRSGIAHDTYVSGDPLHSGSCQTCGESYSKAMAGFIELVNWER